MKYLYLCFAIAVLSTSKAYSQKPVVLYYDSQWRLAKKDSAVYFRTAIFDTTRYVFAGQVRDFTMKAKLIMTGNYKGLRNGVFTFYYENGQVESMGEFSDDIQIGNWKYFYQDGKIKQEVIFRKIEVDDYKLSKHLIRISSPNNLTSNYKILFYNDSLENPSMINGNGFWKEEYYEQNIPQKIISKGYFKDYRKDGEWTCVLENGVKVYTENYKNGKFISGYFYDPNEKKPVEYNSPSAATLLPHFKFAVTERFARVSNLAESDYPFLKWTFRPRPFYYSESSADTTQVFEEVDVSAAPDMGIDKDPLDAIFKEIAKNIGYPAQARRMGIEGKVYLQFIVSRTGILSDFQILKGIGAGCDEEVVRVAKAVMPKYKWSPARKGKYVVRQAITMPFVYKLG